MHCSHCGATIQPGQIFCSVCGSAIAASSPVPASPAPDASPAVPAAARAPSPSPCAVGQHLRVLGILWIVYSGLRLFPGLAMMIFGHMHFPFLLTPVPARMVEFLGPFVFGIGALISIMALAGVAAGLGLMSHSPWARILAIVLGCINLIHLPFGTALGIYTLWVLFSPGAEQEYTRLGAAR